MNYDTTASYDFADQVSGLLFRDVRGTPMVLVAPDENLTKKHGVNTGDVVKTTRGRAKVIGAAGGDIWLWHDGEDGARPMREVSWSGTNPVSIVQRAAKHMIWGLLDALSEEADEMLDVPVGDGKTISLNVSREKCRAVGFIPGDRVTTSRGVAAVMGLGADGKLVFRVEDSGRLIALPHKNPREFETKGIKKLEAPMIDASEVFERAPERPVELFAPLYRQNGHLLVLDAVLPYVWSQGPLVPRPDRYFALDGNTLEVIDKVAMAVLLRQPCLLEWITSASKTSSIAHLAAVLGQPLVRINLNGQTDTSELIGRYVPSDGTLRTHFSELLRELDRLGEESQKIIARAYHNGRALSLRESQMIARNEGIEIPDWIWQNGVVPDAMIHGHWLLLDEVNLGEAQVLERLNPALEKDPVLVLTEHDNKKIGQNGDFPVHPNYRIFWTMNPAEYAGRKPLSPAYKNRWTGFKAAPPPTYESYVGMLELLAFGRQPVAKVRDMHYKAADVEPRYPVVSKVPWMGRLLQRIAKFQVALEELSLHRDIGRGRAEAYVFTRRDLMEFLNFLENGKTFDRRKGQNIAITDNPQLIAARAVQYCFLDKIDVSSNEGREDMRKVVDVLEALQISPEKWSFKFEETNDWRHAPTFMKDLFVWIKTHDVSFQPSAFQWNKVEGSWIAEFVPKYSPPDDLVDSKPENYPLPNARSSQKGFKGMLDFLGNERVESIYATKDGKWYIRIL